MGKYDHICELTGTENYSRWRKQMTLALRGEELWSHCSGGADPSDLANLASTMPTPVNEKAPTDAEKKRFLSWLAKDSQAKALIDRKVSSVIGSMLDESQAARQQWELLAQRYNRKDIFSQYELRLKVRSEKLKDAEDVTRYIAVFEDARRRFLEMGVTYTREESVFDILQGLPQGIEWEIFRELTLSKLSNESTTSTDTSPSSTFTFEDAAKSLFEKANAIVGRRKLAGPGSEYASPTISIKGGTKTNPSTGIRIHRNNPHGIRCVNEACVGKSRADTHDKDHCYWPGGGMESNAPAWIHNRTSKTDKVDCILVRTATAKDEVKKPIERELEEAPRRATVVKAARERAAAELKRKQKEEEKKKKALEMQRKLKHTAGLCPTGYEWIKQAGGYECADGSHFVSDGQLGL